MELDKDFREFIELLNEHEVKYLVIGGYAVNFHGYPRYTKDIDFWIWMKEENISKLLNVLKEFGFSSLGLTTEDFMSPDNIVQLGYEPYRIDLLVSVEGLDFEKSFENRELKKIQNTKVNFLELSDLIEAKKQAGRLQDLADAEQLEKIRKGKK
ncbi:MAG: hypothetical protein ACI81T_002385 [Bacteroidia bacterium]|jgi:hypothetical protein